MHASLSQASGSVTQLTDRDGPDHSPVASPDGRLVAYLGFDDALRAYEDDDLYVMDRSGGSVRNLTAEWGYSPAGIQWDADGRAIYAQYDISGETRVARIGLDGSVRDVVEGGHDSISFTEKEGVDEGRLIDGKSGALRASAGARRLRSWSCQGCGG